MITIDFKLADTNLESSEDYLLKLRKDLSRDFEVIFIVRKNALLNKCRYLKNFLTYKKINNIFLKFHHFYQSYQKLQKSVKSPLLRNAIQKQPKSSTNTAPSSVNRHHVI